MKVFVFLFFLTSAAFAMRIPDPLTKAPITSENGFEIDPSRTQWIRVAPSTDLKNKVEALFKLKSTESVAGFDTKKSNATFSVRVDKQTEFKSLNEYANKWLKSYGQFGLEVLGHQYFKNERDQKGFVIDVANSSSHKKLRQVIFFKNDRAVVLTCMDNVEKFPTTLKACNDLIKSFVWTEKSTTTIEEKLQ